MPECPLRSEAEQDRLLLEIYELAKRIAAQIVVHHQVEDVAHSVVVVCLESLRTGTWPYAPENLEAFVFTMVKNHILDRKRRRRTSARHDSNYLHALEEAPPAWSSPARYDDDADVREFKQYVLDKLPDRCRKAYCMVREEGRSHEEVARELKVSPRTVENYISQAHAMFRVELKLIGIEPGPARRPARPKPARRKWNQDRLVPHYPAPAPELATP